MCRKLTYLICFVLLLSLVRDVQAVNMWWTDAGPDNLWSTPTNWDTGTLPTSSDLLRLNLLPGPTVANEDAVARSVLVGSDGNTGALTVDGGTLTTSTWLPLGLGGTGEGTLNMISGTLTVGSPNGNNLFVGNDGKGTLNMTGGTITAGNLQIPLEAAATGHVNLNGGIISTNNFGMQASGGTMDVTAGTLIIQGDFLSTVQGYIDSGLITAYGGNGTLQLDYNVTSEGATTLKATHFFNPNPADSGLASAGDVVLSWTLPDPCVPGQPVLVDVHFTEDLQLLEEFTDPAAIQIVSKQNVTSVVVQTKPKTRYYWAIDSYIGSDADPVYGPIFSFYADNIPPNVDAGADIVTWLEDGPKTGNLDATVTDEDAYTVQWTVVSEPNEGNAVIETATTEDTSITLSAVGEYLLQLEAFDGEYTGSDTTTINVYNDSCEAAQSLPDYVPLVGDLNGDCIVNDVDLALLQENWLKDNSLTEDWFVVGGL